MADGVVWYCIQPTLKWCQPVAHYLTRESGWSSQAFVWKIAVMSSFLRIKEKIRNPKKVLHPSKRMMGPATIKLCVAWRVLVWLSLECMVWWCAMWNMFKSGITCNCVYSWTCAVKQMNTKKHPHVFFCPRAVIQHCFLPTCFIFRGNFTTFRKCYLSDPIKGTARYIDSAHPSLHVDAGLWSSEFQTLDGKF